ncbi:small integral membrane protein 12 isoform X1 [Emydura macquarii macquarii]|uniref:small integral membrane protein 12 isoform X1 n=1 Tax=Emydura macquarii macquarii TaxID=1129001 RepID=UPI00352B48CD
MWPLLWTTVRAYAPYVTFPVAFVVGAVGYHLEWFIRGDSPQPVEEEKSISERREDRKLQEIAGGDELAGAILAAPRGRSGMQLGDPRSWLAGLSRELREASRSAQRRPGTSTFAPSQRLFDWHLGLE